MRGVRWNRRATANAIVAGVLGMQVQALSQRRPLVGEQRDAVLIALASQFGKSASDPETEVIRDVAGAIDWALRRRSIAALQSFANSAMREHLQQKALAEGRLASYYLQGD